MEKVGIVLLNMGGPKDLDSVKPFLYKLFADPELIRLPYFLKPTQKLIAKIISQVRTSKTKDMYRKIGGGSPILDITQSLANKINKELETYGYDAVSTVCMRYSEPYASDAVEILEKQRPDKILLFSQYPHYAESTTQSSFNDFYKYANKSQLNGVKYQEIGDWGEEQEYIQWWVDGIRKTFSELTQPERKNLHVIFTAHGLPQRYVKKGEKYPDRVNSAVKLIVEELKDIEFQWQLSFQSRAGPVEWTKPYTDTVIEEITEQKPSALIMVPIGFVSNHVETLFEIDILYKELADTLYIPKYVRVEVPDDNDLYCKAITRMLIRYLQR